MALTRRDVVQWTYSIYLSFIAPLTLFLIGIALTLASKYTLIAPVSLPFLATSVPVIGVIGAMAIFLPLFSLAVSDRIRRVLGRKIENFMKWYDGENHKPVPEGVKQNKFEGKEEDDNSIFDVSSESADDENDASLRETPPLVTSPQGSLVPQGSAVSHILGVDTVRGLDGSITSTL